MASTAFAPPSPHQLRNYVGGVWTAAESGITRENVNPADRSDVIGVFPESGGVDAEQAVAEAAGALAGWRGLGPIRRGEYLARAARILEERAEGFARTITREQGKLLTEARAEVRRAVTVLHFVAGEGRRLNGATTPAEDDRTMALTFRRPIGVVGLITPWNFPLAIPTWKVAPALLSGCTAVLKPSPLTPLTPALLVDVFHEAGLPHGVLNLVHGDAAAGEALVAHPRVAGVSFTGSSAVGAAVHHSGSRRLLRTQLELGGKNAVVVLDDADLDKAVPAVVTGAFGQAGQRCSATSRVIVDRRVRDGFLGRLMPRVSALRVGPGADPRSQLGPVVDGDHLRSCLEAVARARGAGAELLCGGGRPAGDLPDGFYMAPTVLSGVAPDAEVAQEEVFGPLLTVIEADGFDDAVRIANGVRYGMSAAVFTTSQSRAFEAVERLEAGMLHVNRPGVGAYAHLPHVGTKASQYGPAECGPQMWDFYTEWRTACIAY
ncbi:aldehyde dehydrogenase family protein [Streptomyces sp. NPDC012693]|jgi:acyl-CoA reductase-like NAD-dependent aldehyde dehydrogenase|uniref:aldehyde dehydrogenase family protein n=1 Tax=unclassified Streptomyces TaxID=2593676 RepID=UPI002030CA9C|nr:aldehyde dehydrogenase family protein [Streptomyces sp. MSC1_001]